MFEWEVCVPDAESGLFPAAQLLAVLVGADPVPDVDPASVVSSDLAHLASFPVVEFPGLRTASSRSRFFAALRWPHLSAEALSALSWVDSSSFVSSASGFSVPAWRSLEMLAALVKHPACSERFRVELLDRVVSEPVSDDGADRSVLVSRIGRSSPVAGLAEQLLLSRSSSSALVGEVLEVLGFSVEVVEVFETLVRDAAASRRSFAPSGGLPLSVLLLGMSDGDVRSWADAAAMAAS